MDQWKAESPDAEEYKHKCPFCSLCFSKPQQLGGHMNTHRHGEAEFFLKYRTDWKLRQIFKTKLGGCAKY